ncbi:MAG: hypothetical protein ACKO9H_20600, partial [Planctomycetota bacterium]
MRRSALALSAGSGDPRRARGINRRGRGIKHRARGVNSTFGDVRHASCGLERAGLLGPLNPIGDFLQVGFFAG